MFCDPKVDKKANVDVQHAHETHDEMVCEIGIQNAQTERIDFLALCPSYS